MLCSSFFCVDLLCSVFESLVQDRQNSIRCLFGPNRLRVVQPSSCVGGCVCMRYGVISVHQVHDSLAACCSSSKVQRFKVGRRHLIGSTVAAAPVPGLPLLLLAARGPELSRDEEGFWLKGTASPAPRFTSLRLAQESTTEKEGSLLVVRMFICVR